MRTVYTAKYFCVFDHSVTTKSLILLTDLISSSIFPTIPTLVEETLYDDLFKGNINAEHLISISWRQSKVKAQ